jgi:hypothetical protein
MDTSKGKALGRLSRLPKSPRLRKSGGANDSPVRVECYSGHTYAEEPRTVIGPEGRAEVAEVLRRWREPEGPAFRVRLSDGAIRTLVYHEAIDQWFIREDTE